MPPRVRAFVAVALAPPSAPAPDGEADPAPPHLTLRFLGEIDDDRTEPIATTLRDAVRELPPFDFTLEGVGAFPSRGDPRVVWVGATLGAEQVTDLAARVSAALAAAGIPPELHDFAPHVTLFRVRSPRDRSRARLLLDGAEPPPPPRVVHVAAIVLKESTLTRAGPVHRTLGTFALGGPVPSAR